MISFHSLSTSSQQPDEILDQLKVFREFLGQMSKAHCSRRLVFFRSNFANRSCASMFFLARRGFLLATLPKQVVLGFFFLTVLQWTCLNILNEAGGIWNEVLGFFVLFCFLCRFSKHRTAWPWGEFTWTPTLGKPFFPHMWLSLAAYLCLWPLIAMTKHLYS